MEAVGTHAPPSGRAGRSRRLLGIASDELLVRRVRAGSEAAFAVLYERHYRNLLSFCRHMLGSADEAEDAVQQAFFNALQDMQRHEKELNFRPWLFRIARNLCISALRARRHDLELAETEPSLVGLSQQVAERRELRELLRDLARLPLEQREALVLAELHGNSHAEVAEILGCEREKVKSLVFQARSSLMLSREAREVSCEEIRRQLSVLRGGSLRRGIIRRHVKECEGCRRFQQEVKRQRQALALVLPVIPSATLKLGAASAAAAAGLKGVAGGAAVGGGAAAGGSAAGGALSASLATVAAKLGVPLAVVKGVAATAAVTVVAAGGTAGVKATHEIVAGERPAPERTSEERDAAGAGREVPVTPPGEPGLVEGRRAAGALERRGGVRGRAGLRARRNRASRERPGRPDQRGRRGAPGHAQGGRGRLERSAGRPAKRRTGREKTPPQSARPRRSATRRDRASEGQRPRRYRQTVPRRTRRQQLPLAREGDTSLPPQRENAPVLREGDIVLPQR